ncbi:MAG: YdeI/OmpD-associated family protein [Gemmatimonadetes bacterium]|nr:YdeI/OmpD-associated family protein [Gemmatimonadota bacterium]
MPPRKPPRPTYFATAAAFRDWLGAHHTSVSELTLGFYKKDSGRTGITYPEALDEALCFGWIDGVRRSVDVRSFSIRFTPRKARSYWSRVNRAKVEVLLQAGRMMPAGLAAWERRDVLPPDQYAFERPPAEFTPAMERTFRRNAPAWRWLSTRPAGYRRLVTHWVVSAKQEATRERRLATLIECCAAGRAIPGYLGKTPGEARGAAKTAAKKATGRSPRPVAPPRPPTKTRSR